jgi:hypothetical protein
MEPFFDGGLFELLLLLGLAVCVNGIFLKRSLLLLFSMVTIACPVALFFVTRHNLYYVLVGICVWNAMLLIALLWNEKSKHPEQPLFDTTALRKKWLAIKNRLQF